MQWRLTRILTHYWNSSPSKMHSKSEIITVLSSKIHKQQITVTQRGYSISNKFLFLKFLSCAHPLVLVIVYYCLFFAVLCLWCRICSRSIHRINCKYSAKSMKHIFTLLHRRPLSKQENIVWLRPWIKAHQRQFTMPACPMPLPAYLA